MATKYYVNKEKDEDGDHEVHEGGCKYLPAAENRQYLGLFESCAGAVEEAKKTYETANGCVHCSEECHTS